MGTLDDEIKAWKLEYSMGDSLHKSVMRKIAAVEHFKAEMIWEFVKSQPKEE